ncbi:hypothetical protein ACFC1B_01605 [Streptomyces xiamenensis]|uniref:hypothetical protein n=1 Tax=Streptomyces TaxID=1883 RepID=UPI000A7C1814|nr:hypothetical protein [Streptomyces sp. NRRL F-2890]
MTAADRIPAVLGEIGELNEEDGGRASAPRAVVLCLHTSAYIAVSVVGDTEPSLPSL